MTEYTPEYMGHVVNKSLGVYDTNIDAWGKVKISKDYSLFSSSFSFDIDESLWILPATVTNTGTCSSINGALVVNSGTTIGSTAQLKSKRHPKYQPNRGSIYSTACILPNIKDGDRRRFGMFTDENGVFFELLGKTMYCVVRSYISGVLYEDRREIPKSIMENIDLSKGNVYDIQFQWRGMGNYRFFINLEEVLVFEYLGVLDRLSLTNPALPPRYEVANLTNASETKIIVGCIDISSENGQLPRLKYHSAANQIIKTVTNAPVIALKSNSTINGLHNTRDLRILRASVSSDKKAIMRIYVTRDLTALTGANWITTGTNSFSTDVAATALDTAKCKLLATRIVDANVVQTIEGYADYIEQIMTHDDIMIIHIEASVAGVYAALEIGEEI